MIAYYNEIEPYAAQWLRNLIAAGMIAPGDVDERDIREVKADDLKGYTQCHFFAGIGGWSLALRMAGWDDTRPVWTGSCPCQPFSAAGRQKGTADERHLWPVWHRLIREYRPSVIFGEQVASAITFGWLDEVATDMEIEGYAIGAAVLPACSVGAPHRRDRLWFVADTESIRSGTGLCKANPQQYGNGTSRNRSRGGTMANADSAQFRSEPPAGHQPQPQQNPRNDYVEHTEGPRLQVTESARESGETNAGGGARPRPAGTNFWDGCEWLDCPDGKSRPVKPSIRLLAHGIPARVGRLRAFGNAIVPQIAAEFIGAFLNVDRMYQQIAFSPDGQPPV
jgi:DNA (cytosine-5)-methyltransferase 1